VLIIFLGLALIIHYSFIHSKLNCSIFVEYLEKKLKCYWEVETIIAKLNLHRQLNKPFEGMV